MVAQGVEVPPQSPIAFLQSEWTAFFEAAAKAESLVHPDARAACFHARRGLELAMQWLYKHDPELKLPYQDNLPVQEGTSARPLWPIRCDSLVA
ncbi:DUF4145 domain-containing protein [Archangium gephyra]|uniref:hypothetical protein n=1 Tax=Archangium gephyra TaxID=48 RepID=UPI0035D44F87